MEFVFPHRNSPPSGQRVGDSQPPNSIHARLPLRHQANFAAFVPRERPQLAFFTPCCKKITQRKINFLSGELPFCRWLDATVLRICDRFYWLKRAFNCPRPRFDCRGACRNRLSVSISVCNCEILRARLGEETKPWWFRSQPPRGGVCGLEGRMTAAPGWVSGEPDSSCGNRLSGDANKRPQFCRAGPRTAPFGSARLRRRFRQAESCSEPRRQSGQAVCARRSTQRARLRPFRPGSNSRGCHIVAARRP